MPTLLKPQRPAFSLSFLKKTVAIEARLRLLLASVVALAFYFGAPTWLGEPISLFVGFSCFFVLFVTILMAAFGVVREADHLAHELGEPYGTLILTLAVVSIEVILISVVMLGPMEFPSIGRDSIFAVMMIIMNLVCGLCLLFGGLKHGEQEYNWQGAISYLSMIALLTGTALVLPKTLGDGAGEFSTGQALSIGVMTAVLYGIFLALQLGPYRRLYVQPPAGALVISHAEHLEITQAKARADWRSCLIRSIVLIAFVMLIVVLAHHLAVLIGLGVAHIGAPVALGGLLIAIIVFTPESIVAVKAARANQMQRAMNLCLGAFLSTVGLTVPAILLIGLVAGKSVVLGLGQSEIVLLVLTVILTAFSFAGARTSPMQGLMHLGLFSVYVILLFAA